MVPTCFVLSLAACASAPPPPPAPPPLQAPVQSTQEMQVAPPGDFEMNVATKQPATAPQQDPSPQGGKSYQPNLSTPSKRDALLK